MTNHSSARSYARSALERVLGQSSLPVERALAGVACLETGYGDGWKGSGNGSNNMGAIQAGSWVGETFAYTDTHPNADGTSTPYRIAFRKYATPAAGWEDLVRVVFINRGRSLVLNAAKSCDLLGVSQALHATGYYEGFGATVEQRIANHHSALARCVRAADLACQATTGPEPGEIQIDAEHMPTLRRGSRGESVRAMQQLLGIVADGAFGPVTEAALRSYQASRHMTVDGVCGPLTWAKLARDGNA